MATGNVEAMKYLQQTLAEERAKRSLQERELVARTNALYEGLKAQADEPKHEMHFVYPESPPAFTDMIVSTHWTFQKLLEAAEMEGRYLGNLGRKDDPERYYAIYWPQYKRGIRLTNDELHSKAVEYAIQTLKQSVNWDFWGHRIEYDDRIMERAVEVHDGISLKVIPHPSNTLPVQTVVVKGPIIPFDTTPEESSYRGGIPSQALFFSGNDSHRIGRR